MRNAVRDTLLAMLLCVVGFAGPLVALSLLPDDHQPTTISELRAHPDNCPEDVKFLAYVRLDHENKVPAGLFSATNNTYYWYRAYEDPEMRGPWISVDKKGGTLDENRQIQIEGRCYSTHPPVVDWDG